MHFIHESLLASSVRSFLKTLFAFLGAAVSLGLILLSASFLSSPYIDPFRAQLILCPDESGSTDLHPNTPVILKVGIEGIIGTKGLNTELVSQCLMKATQLIKKDRIKAVLLHINSPGGTSVDSAGIYHAIQAFKATHQIPVHAFVDGMCASGGMYIACAADKIQATEDSVLGSVGVRLGPIFNFSTVMEKIGIGAMTITQGKDKDNFNPFRPWKADEGEDIKNLIAETYQQFVNVVVKSRPKLNADLLIEKLGAQIFSARKSILLGYADAIATDYYQAVKDLRQSAMIPENALYQVIEVTPYKSPLDTLMDTKLALFSKSLPDQLTRVETKNPLCDRVLYLID